MKKFKVNEIFYSLQGEGRWAGTPAIFIRFAGCNLKCDFCDTNHNPYKEYTVDEILQEILSYPAIHVILTGGEPTLQISENLLNELHALGKFVHVETNGTRDVSKEILDKIDWVTCSPKAERRPRIQHIDELKVVYTGQDVSRYESVKVHCPGCYYLQPCDKHDARQNEKNLKSTIEYVKKHPIWKLSLQTQKLLKIQ